MGGFSKGEMAPHVTQGTITKFETTAPGDKAAAARNNTLNNARTLCQLVQNCQVAGGRKRTSTRRRTNRKTTKRVSSSKRRHQKRSRRGKSRAAAKRTTKAGSRSKKHRKKLLRRPANTRRSARLRGGACPEAPGYFYPTFSGESGPNTPSDISRSLAVITLRGAEDSRYDHFADQPSGVRELALRSK